MDKKQVAAILSEIGTLLELHGENAFRCNAYHNAARTIEQLDTELSDLIAQGKLGTLKGIGETLQEKITALVTTGKLQYYDDLRAKTPPGLLELLKVQGLGPKKVKALYDELKIDSLDRLKEACDRGDVARLKGFGQKTQDKILAGLEFIRLTGNRVRIDQALPIAQMVVEELRKLPQVQRIELCGSLRRRRETIKDMDILVSSNDPTPIMDKFVRLPWVVQITGQGDTKSSVVFSVGSGQHKVMIAADLRVLSDDIFPFGLHYFTGSKEHNIAMRARAQQRGLKLSEYGLVGPNISIPARDEADIFRALGLQYIPPEMREDTGELELAERGEIPKLVEAREIQGVFHNHTTWSDGMHSLEEMAAAARKMGLKYLGIGDHSRSLRVANGLSIERVNEQLAAIDDLNARMDGFHIFKGTECDILEDGSLDYPDEVLARFDYVVASVHTHFKQSKEEMTARIVRALQNPHVTMLGHPTGRLLLARDGYQVDLDVVLQEAARHGKMIEINAQPLRLDLDWVHVKKARTMGIPLVINPDAHSTEELALFAYGVDVARRGWLEKRHVFNTLSLAEVASAFKARKKPA